VILTALQLEMRNLLRSPLRFITLFLVLGAGVFVLVQGQQDIVHWKNTISEGEKAQEASIAEARGYLSVGEKGPADRSWVDLRQAHWQDYYAANRMARIPAPLAGIAFASAESGAATVRINRFADPLLAQGNKIENPALAAAGGLDLVTVLALLLPLLILALGIEVGGYERATGLLPLIRVQSGRDRSWIWARSIAVGLIAAVVGIWLSLLAIAIGGADSASGLVLLLLVLGYVAVWTTLLGVIAQISKNPSHGAVALGAAWIVICVLIPSIGVERSASLAADDFALDLTVEARDEVAEAFQIQDKELFESLLNRFPSLTEYVPEDRRSARRSAIDGLSIIALEDRMLTRQLRGKDYRELVARISLLTPSVAFTRALERLAGRGPEAAWNFRSAVVDAVANRMERAIAAEWQGKPLGAQDFEELVAATPAAVTPLPLSWTKEFILLIAWAIALLLCGTVVARRLGR
jgi:ABC-2 type transport system permease protein